MDSSAAECVSAYNKSLSELIDSHAPVIHRTIILRPHAPWYTDELRSAKRERRRLERQWQKHRLEIHHQLYKNQCHIMNRLLLKARRDYVLSKITECGKDQKGIFKITNRLLGAGASNLLPQHTSACELADRFGEYFTQKIVQISYTD